MPTIEVDVNPSFAIDRIKVVLRDLPADCNITLHATTTIESGNKFESIGNYKSDSTGVVDLSLVPSSGGTYHGVDAMAFVWAMKPSQQNERSHARFIKHYSETPLDITLHVYVGHFPDASAINTQTPDAIAVKTIRRYYQSDVEKVVLDGEVKGYLYVPKGKQKYPGVMNLYGAVMGTFQVKPSVLASQGYVVLGLIYFGKEDGLNDDITKVNLECIEKAINFLRSHPRVEGSKGIAINTISTGTTVCLGAVAQRFPGIKCVIAMNGPIYVSHTTLIYKGKELYDRLPILDEKYNIITHVPEFNSMEAKASLIPFYLNKDVDVLYLTSMDDKSMPIASYADHIDQIKEKMGCKNVRVIRYEGAGHLLEIPYMPYSDKVWFPVLNRVENFGGNAKQHHLAQLKAWNDITVFLKGQFRCKRNSSKL